MAYKFVNADQLDADMAAVANAIRSKGGTSDKLAFPNGMISAISNISTGVELDFDVVAYASEEALLAAVPAENTIGVITTTDISGWAMGDYPDPSWEMSEGFLYINIKASSYGSSDLDFGLLKKGNEICIAPISAKQYVSGTYVDVTCKSYQNGAWADWWNGEIYTTDNEYENITGGWTDTIIGWDSSYSKNGNIRHTQNKLDLTNYDSIEFDGLLTTTSNADYSYVGVWSELGTYHTQNRVAKVNNSGYDGVTSLDISSLSGPYYVGVFTFNGGSIYGTATIRSIRLVESD